MMIFLQFSSISHSPCHIQFSLLSTKKSKYILYALKASLCKEPSETNRLACSIELPELAFSFTSPPNSALAVGALTSLLPASHLVLIFFVFRDSAMVIKRQIHLVWTDVALDFILVHCKYTVATS